MDEDDEEMRRVEAVLERLKRLFDDSERVQKRSFQAIRNTVDGIPEVVANAFDDAAFEQGEAFRAAMLKGTEPFAESVSRAGDAIERLVQHQGRLTNLLRGCFIACGLLLGLLIAGNLLTWHVYAKASARAEALESLWLQIIEASKRR